MEIDSGTTASSYTILRIKRKRNEEPLDALVIESRVRRKKSRGGMGVFQFAQTVEHDAWQDEGRQKDIQDQISRLARDTEASAEPKPSKAESPSTRPQKDDPYRRYTILKAENTEKEPQKDLPHPPKVLSTKELQAKKPDFRMYDAILATEKSAPSAPIDSEMEKFLPMLNDYLRLHDLPTTSSSASLALSEKSGVEDYVWDVFYHRPATLSEWNQAAKVGTLYGVSSFKSSPSPSVR
ncbi:hypothetical protein BD779DRAFT_1498770 [Infundibulicybe gibba]|nr:hypothetical protein BD779DRAFT_1498770 [Infundibulicybe gibba]